MKNMASIMELWSKSQSVYRTLEEQDMSWLLWTLIILLMNVLGGLAALVPLFNLNPEQVWLIYNLPRNSPVVAGQKMTKSYPFFVKKCNLQFIRRMRVLHMHNVFTWRFHCNNVREILQLLAGCASWFQQRMLMMLASHYRKTKWQVFPIMWQVPGGDK